MITITKFDGKWRLVVQETFEFDSMKEFDSTLRELVWLKAKYAELKDFRRKNGKG